MAHRETPAVGGGHKPFASQIGTPAAPQALQDFERESDPHKR